MAIVNRTKDPSEQRLTMQVTNAATATGVTLTLGVVPWPSVLEVAQIAAWGLSGAPGYAIALNRFIAGTGFTTIVLTTGTTCTPAEFGTSGPGVFGASVFGGSGMIYANAIGSTLMSLQANDLLTVTSAVANTAVKGLAVSVTLKPIQDIKVNFGLL